jgi:hypothetical protein
MSQKSGIVTTHNVSFQDVNVYMKVDTDIRIMVVGVLWATL